MENIEQRLHCLSEDGCRICGFTINNATPEQQDCFLKLLEKASSLQVLALTELRPLSEIANNWQRSQAKQYRKEKEIEQHAERVAYFYEQTLPVLTKIVPQLSSLRELNLINIKLSEAETEALAKSHNSCYNIINYNTV